MAKTVCPGQDTRFWRPEDVFEVSCASCGRAVEFFKDDAHRRCPGCGQRVLNPKLNLGCAQWCAHAKECLGFDPKESLGLAQGAEAALADRLVAAVKKELGPDQESLGRALAALDRAEEILKTEGGRARVVLAASLLFGLAEEKAMAIIKEAGLEAETREQVKAIFAGADDFLEARIVQDAVRLAELRDEKPAQKEAARKIEAFKTRTGREMARRIFWKD